MHASCHSVKTQAMSVLNHAGICLSYNATWIYLTKLIEEADYMGQLKEGQWLWIYDNLNLHQTIRHERQGMNVYILEGLGIG